MCVSCRMLLRLEECVEVPEAALNILVGGHLLKAHLGEDPAELAANLQCAAQHRSEHDLCLIEQKTDENASLCYSYKSFPHPILRQYKIPQNKLPIYGTHALKLA